MCALFPEPVVNISWFLVVHLIILDAIVCVCLVCSPTLPIGSSIALNVAEIICHVTGFLNCHERMFEDFRLCPQARGSLNIIWGRQICKL